LLPRQDRGEASNCQGEAEAALLLPRGEGSVLRHTSLDKTRRWVSSRVTAISYKVPFVSARAVAENYFRFTAAILKTVRIDLANFENHRDLLKKYGVDAGNRSGTPTI